MAYFAGMRGTGSYGTDERPKSFREMILWMQPNGTSPLFALTSKMKTETVDDPEFNWWEETLQPCRLRVNGALNNSVTTVVVDGEGLGGSTGGLARGALELIVGDLLQVELGTELASYATGNMEILRVTAVASDTSFTVQRGAAGSTAASIGDNAWLTRVGNAQTEGTGAPNSSSGNPTKFTNKTQIFKTPYEITGTDLSTYKRTGDALKNEQKRKSFQHAEKIEQALFWGLQSETTDASNGNRPLRTMGGLRSMVVSNNTIFAANPTLATFSDALTPVFNFDAGSAGNERLIFCGNGALNYLNTIVQGTSGVTFNYDGIVKYYGMDLTKYVMPQGTVYFKTHPLFNVHPVYTYSMFVLNPSGLIYRPLKGRDTKVQKDIQAPDQDSKKDQWITECSMELHYERTFAYIGGFKKWS